MYLIKNSGLSFRLTNEETQQLNNTAEFLQKDGNTTITSAKNFVLILSQELLKLKDENEELKKQLEQKENEIAEQLYTHLEEIKKTREEVQRDKELELQILRSSNQELKERLLQSQQALEQSGNEQLEAEQTTTESVQETEQESDSTEFENQTMQQYQKLIELIGYETEPTELQLFNDLIDIISQPQEPETIEKNVEIERELAKNEFLLQLEEPQATLLEKIARWRYQTKRDPQRLQIPQLIRRMIFNKGTLFNWHGEFDTGISEKRLKQKN